MHAPVLGREARQPGLLRGEAQHRRQPGGRHRCRWSSTVRTRAGGGCPAVAVEHVLADVEVERRQVGGAERVDLRIHAGPVIPAARPAIRPSSSASRCSTQRSSSGSSASGTRSLSSKPARLPSSQRSVLRSRRYSSACCFRISGPIRKSSAMSEFIIHSRRMSAPYLLRHLLRRGDVAERLRHLAALLVEHEPMRQHRPVRRRAAGADRLEQRGVEPAAMLVRSLQIQVRRPAASPRSSMANPCVLPLSNQTSTMSITCS